MRTKGKITSWNDEKGYGFITPLFGGDAVFVHVKGFNARCCRPEVGQTVTYEVSSDKRGRPCAENVISSGNKVPIKNRKRNRNRDINGGVALALMFIGFVAMLVLFGKVAPVILAVYVGLSLLTYFMYATDKKAAKKGRWRTKESTLHLFALAGGWPGALIAQQNLRHKSQKQSFRSVFWITVLSNGLIFFWLVVSPQGGMYLHSLSPGF